MKKLALTIAIVLGITMGASAQGLFERGYSSSEANEPMRSSTIVPGLPSAHNVTTNQDAPSKPLPLGSGVVVLMGLGAAYMAAKKRKED